MRILGNSKKERRKMMKCLLLLLIPVMAFSIGCGMPYTVGTPLDKAKVDQIIPGTTSEDKVVEMLGQPTKKEIVGEGQMKYVYIYYSVEPKFWVKDVERKTALEVLTQNGVVQKYEFKREGVDSINP
jgi:outer membrane protein assembly factor BamE (lipoprotein component of BamABCDE complex)